MTYRDPSDEYDECPRCGDEYRVTRHDDDLCPECREREEEERDR